MLILASSSPRRQELLRAARILFKVQAAEVPEVRRPDEPPRAYAERLAREKARAVYGAVRPPAGTFVLGADTVVIVDGAVLEKPADDGDAARMLRLLSGRQHEVTTGVCLIGVSAPDPTLARCAREAGAPDERGAPDEGGAPGNDSLDTGNGRRGTLFEDVRCETTRVFFCELSDEEIEEYVATGEPMDKAGAYGIQGMASRWIPRIQGCYFNVVGLPVALVCRMLREHGAQ